MKFCMADNIKIWPFLKIKIAKIAQKNTRILLLAKLTLTLHNKNVFANTTNNCGVYLL